jgi:hypothetical protein
MRFPREIVQVELGAVPEQVQPGEAAAALKVVSAGTVSARRTAAAEDAPWLRTVRV